MTMPPRIGMISSLTVSAGTFLLGWTLRPEAAVTGPEPTEESVQHGARPSAQTRGSGSTMRAKVPKNFTKSEGKRLHELLADLSAPKRSGSSGAFQLRALSSADITLLGNYLKQETDPIKRREVFARLLEGMTVENAREIRAQIAHLSSEHAEFRDFHFAWGQMAGAEAVLNGTETPKADMHVAMRGWASSDPSGAMTWYRGLQTKGNGYVNQGYLKTSMVDGLALHDPKMAGSFVEGLASGGDRSARYLMSRVSESVLKNQGLEGALAWSQSLTNGDLQPAALVPVAREYTRKDPRAAAEWVEQFSASRQYADVVGKVGHEWARRDLKSAIAWSETLSEGQPRNNTVSAIYGQWAAREPLQAVEAIMQMQDGTDRNFALNGFISGLAGQDAERAVMWAAEISEPGLREAAVVRAGQRYYQQDREAASSWMQSQGLSPELQQKVRGEKD